MNPVLILTHNCLELTKRCVYSVRKQDIPTVIFAIDNGSTDGSRQWLEDEGILMEARPNNDGVSRGWNSGLSELFDKWPRYTASAVSSMAPHHALVLNNDVMLPPHFYGALLQLQLPFVTGASVECIEGLQNKGPYGHPYPAPDFSGFLIRRAAWEKVGPFDESMKHYASDCDWHIRAHKAGIPLMNSGIPFYHERSSTLRNATPEERRVIERQADVDRDAFRAKWGCYPWEESYAAFFR